ncbi:dihydrofolate reductase [Halostagnicola sp. A-GB9-2]|uniref:dihydrofolate reductase n=1 Tax=Halostagnicola sp. A-GB9-2 TaxID=3048066 RepID=UPI0024C04DF8|nr:dihydrofolate reductase [Halostagnicola sp. A-GB9-2]MDJ1433406.1 dihydrofolate reductase [Halostagnicola sp. A-GB9-2]
MSGDGRTGTVDSPALETNLELVGIVAVAENGVIGKDGDMPWHVPEDLKHFKETTIDHPVIMGRVTYEGILEALGEPLPGRTTIVLTSRDLETPENAVVANSLEDALEAAQTADRERHGGTERAFIAGGATVYEQFLPALDRLVVTEIHDEPDGDTHFPEWDRDGEWEELARDERDGFSFLEYSRVKR